MKASRLVARIAAIASFSLAFGAGLFFQAELSFKDVAAFAYLLLTITVIIISTAQGRHQRRWVIGACGLTFVPALLSLPLLATDENFRFSYLLGLLAFAAFVSALIMLAARGEK